MMCFEINMNERGLPLKNNKRPYILILFAENKLRPLTREIQKIQKKLKNGHILLMLAEK